VKGELGLGQAHLLGQLTDAALTPRQRQGHLQAMGIRQGLEQRAEGLGHSSEQA
jgi:hypothetical protein